LAAVHYHGQGKVAVFGDTAAFQNGSMPEGYEFIERLFAYLTSHREPRVYAHNVLLSLLLLVGAVALALSKRGMGTTLLLTCSLAAGLSSLATTALNARRVPEGRITGPVAYVDASHLERFSAEIWDDNAVTGLHANLMRNGYLPVTFKEFSEAKLRQAQLLVIIAPTRPFSAREIATINDFAAQGGVVVISVGWEERHASNALLKSFKVRLGDVPLGPGHTAQATIGEERRLRFYEAWPVISEAEGAITLATAFDYPVIVLQPWGEGHVLVIGDSGFLLNKRLEGKEYYNEDNILFLREVFEVMGKETAE